MKNLLLVPALIAGIILLSACDKKEVDKDNESTLKIVFEHKAGSDELIFNDCRYTNAAGNPYEISEIMYFISDVKLYKGGVTTNLNHWDDIHYIDTKISTTLEWIIGNKIKEGEYDSITFVFGLSEQKNKSFLFVNPPEVNMAWPEVLGGGYHYMMLNGFWKDLVDQRKPFNFHLGIGQIYEGNSGQVSDITGFVQNYFTVRPDGPKIRLNPGKTTTINLVMNVQSWFETPHVYDFNYWGGSIMQKQDAMHIACVNGRDVFSYHVME